MLTIPSIPKGYGPWQFKCFGKAPNLIKNLIEEIVKIVLVHEKIKKKALKIDLISKNRAEMEILNKEILGKEGATDVISQPIDSDSLSSEHPTLLGALILCWPIIKEDAEHLKRDEIQHLAHIVIHGTLHLLNYRHEGEEDRRRMESKEIAILAKLGIQSPYLGFDPI